LGLKVGEKEKLIFSIHGVGRLLVGQSPSTHHFWGLQAVKRQKEAQIYQGLEGLGMEAFQASVGLFLFQSK
jgi:hypothetical protein